MYETFLGFHSRPFASTPCGEQLLFGQSMQKALANARHCIERGSGPALIVGAPGVGKSLLLTTLGQQYRDQFHIVNMSCSRLDGRLEFLQTALFELRQPYRGLSEGELRLSLLDFLRSDKEKPNGILLLIDDGENLSVEVLDEIRVVSNFVQDGQPRTRLVLAGGYRLEELLTDSRLHSLNQRIAARCFLRNMSHAECDEFVRDQIRRAGGNAELFNSESQQAIFELTEGCPRFVNQLCDHVLILCATNGLKQVDAAMVNEAWSDLQCFPDAFQGAKGSSSFCQATNEIVGQQEKWSIIEFGSLDEASPSETTIHSVPTFDQTFDQSFEPPYEPTFESPFDSRDDLNNGEYEDSTDSRFEGPESDSNRWDTSRHDKQEFQSFTTEAGSGWKFSSGESYNPYESQTFWDQTSESPGQDQPAAHWDIQTQYQSNSASEQPEPEPETTYSAPNPFDEQFDEVEVVTSRFASQIAQCNRASQGLTPGDLSCLNAIADTRDSQSCSSLSIMSACCDKNESCAHQSGQSTDRYCQSEEQQSGSGIGQDELQQENLQDSFQPIQDAPETTASQVEQEADALLQQLSNAFGEPIDHFQRRHQDSQQNSDDQAYTLRLPSEGVQGTTQVSLPEARPQDAEIEELNSLKQALEEQNRFSAKAFDRLIVQTNSQSAAEGWRIQPVQAEETPVFSPTVRQPDDREILICQPSDSVSNEMSQSAERLPFPPTPVSTGRAERMDYQQLFNQLRNLPET